ncbi:MAG: hypothetical protein P8177_00195 [Gemmatimonadota bacterium]|jgi:hypothetical protein
MRRTWIAGLALAAVGGALACGEEDPTEVGAGLVGDGFRTYEVILGASEFLRADTTYDRLGRLNGVPFSLVAEDFEGELDAHTLFQLSLPDQITYQNDDGQSVTDTAFTVTGAQLTLVLDSLADATPPVRLEVVQVMEEWHPPTVTWDLRVDTSGVGEPWAEPGGTPGPILGSGTWESGDTVRVRLNGASAAALTDSAALRHGGLVRSATPGARLRILTMDFAFEVAPPDTDTILEIGSLLGPTVVATPEPTTPAATESRVGGVPAWRTALEFQPLADLTIPCGPERDGCMVPLADVNVNLAVLLLEPVPVGSRRIERPMQIENRLILQGPGVPLTRSPMSSVIGGMLDTLQSADFTTSPPEPNEARVIVTEFVQAAIAPRDAGDSDPVLWLALTAQNEPSFPIFGYAAFGSLDSAVPPRLQLLVTAPAEDGP